MEEQRKQEIARWHEKDKLFQLSEEELAAQPADVQYTRMRYEREIEAFEFVHMIKYMPRAEAIIAAHTKALHVVKNWNSLKKSPQEWR